MGLNRYTVSYKLQKDYFTGLCRRVRNQSQVKKISHMV